MIRHLSLRSWRAYERLDIDLSIGTTFIVAANGVGKTSFMLGLTWAVYGDDAPVDPRECIRAGHSEAAATVEIELEDERVLSIVRTVRRKGHGTVHASLDGVELTARELEELHEEEFGVAPAVAARLALLAGRGEAAAASSLNLEDHLYRAFGLDHLVVNAEAARRAAKAAARTVTKTRQTSAQRLNRAAVERELEHARGDLVEAQEEARRADVAVQSADELLRAALDAAEAAERSRARSIELSEALTEASRVLVDVRDGAEATAIARALQARTAELVASVEETRAAEHEADGRRRAAEHGLSLLSAAAAHCPTCLRPLDEEQLEQAVEAQTIELTSARADELAARANREAAEAELVPVQRLATRVPPLLTFDGDEPLPAVGGGLQAARQRHSEVKAAHERALRAVGEAEGRIKRLQSTLDEDERSMRENEEVRRAYRAQALAEATADALEGARDRAIETLIEPIALEVRNRWKQLYGDSGLVLRADGSMGRAVADRELDWSSLSGGEQTWARVVVHLLIVGVSTRLPFAWFDEPLEHLDPAHRVTVAAVLADATRRGNPRQLLVTTYEHALAEQLSEGRNDTSLVVLRRGEGR